MDKAFYDELNDLVEAQELWVRDGGHSAEGPLSQRAALVELEQLEVRYKTGDAFVLMDAIYRCSCHGLRMPEWVAAGFRSGYQKILSCDDDSLDDVFGKPYPKGKHLNALKKKRNLRFLVWCAVREVIKRDPEASVNRDLFKKVATELRPPIAGSEAEKLYYEAKKMFPS